MAEKELKKRVGLVVSGEWGLMILPRTVKIHPRQREEDVRGNLKEMTIRANTD